MRALVPSQQSGAVIAAFETASFDAEYEWFVPSSVFLEFPSILRKFTNQRRIDAAEANDLLMIVQDLPGRRYGTTPELVQRAWDIATRAQQSDIFDSFGLAVAEEVDAEFWTSDLRFANATANFAADRVKYFS